MKPADELECTEVFYFSNDTVDKALRLANVDIHRKYILASLEVSSLAGPPEAQYITRITVGYEDIFGTKDIDLYSDNVVILLAEMINNVLKAYREPFN